MQWSAIVVLPHTIFKVKKKQVETHYQLIARSDLDKTGQGLLA